jgi:hypothetical protein
LSTRRFEGPDLDTVLARARAEVGSGARVLSAERVRSGGLGGFFARERVEIEVEVDDDAPPAPVGPEPDAGPAAAPGSLLDLVDLVNRSDHHDVGPPIRPDRIEPAPPVHPDAGHPLAGPPPPPPPPAPVVSTETTTFAEILERITAQAEAPPEAPPPLPAAPASDVPPAAVPVPFEPVAFEPVPRAEVEPARRPVRLVSPARAAVPALRAAASEPGPLTRLGLPPELEPSGPDLRTSLLEQLARLPEPPALPNSRGTVVAVIGARGTAHHVARTVCLRVGGDPSTIATVTGQRRQRYDPELTSVDEVSDNRRAWRRRPLPTVVVVDAPLGRPLDWVGPVLGALEPTAVWGVVEASRKEEDIAAWSEDLGGLDALCLTALDDTVSPASPLRTGLPVALLDGETATPERWADLLLSRIAS